MARSIPLVSQGCVHSWIQKRLLLLHTDPRCCSDSKMVSRLWNRCPRLPEIMDLSCSPNWGEHQGAIKLPRQTFSFAMNLPFGLECWSRGSYIWSGLFCSDFRTETCTFWALCIRRHLSLRDSEFGQDKASQVTCSEALLCLDGCSLLFRLCHLQGIHHILVMFWSLKTKPLQDTCKYHQVLFCVILWRDIHACQ